MAVCPLRFTAQFVQFHLFLLCSVMEWNQLSCSFLLGPSVNLGPHTERIILKKTARNDWFSRLCLFDPYKRLNTVVFRSTFLLKWEYWIIEIRSVWYLFLFFSRIELNHSWWLLWSLRQTINSWWQINAQSKQRMYLLFHIINETKVWGPSGPQSQGNTSVDEPDQ